MIKKIMELPEQQQIMLAVLAAAALGAFWYYLIFPVSAQMEALDQRVNELLAEVETAQAIAARRPQFEADVQELSGQLDELKKVLPDEKETAEIVRRVEQLAVESDLSIRSFTPQATVAYEFYEDWPIRMSLEGATIIWGFFSKGWPTSSALSTSIILQSKPSPIRIQTEPSQQLVRPLRLFFWNKEPN